MINLTTSAQFLATLRLSSSTSFDVGVSVFNRSGCGLGDASLRNLSNAPESMNGTNDGNDTSDKEWSLTVYSQEHLVVTSTILGLFVLCCIIGNCFVIAAVILERSLHNVANYLILSLAVADLMVAVLVMPLSVVSEISQVSCSCDVCCLSAADKLFIL